MARSCVFAVCSSVIVHRCSIPSIYALRFTGYNVRPRYVYVISYAKQPNTLSGDTPPFLASHFILFLILALTTTQLQRLTLIISHAPRTIPNNHNAQIKDLGRQGRGRRRARAERARAQRRTAHRAGARCSRWTVSLYRRAPGAAAGGGAPHAQFDEISNSTSLKETGVCARRRTACVRVHTPVTYAR